MGTREEELRWLYGLKAGQRRYRIRPDIQALAFASFDNRDSCHDPVGSRTLGWREEPPIGRSYLIPTPLRPPWPLKL